MGTNAVVKVVFLGDGAVGKTALVRRFCHNQFEESRVMTIGVDFQVKEVELNGKTVKLSIWDVAGQERFQSVRENFYRGSQAAALVYDCTDPQSFKNLKKWVEEIQNFSPNVKFILVANKQDLGEDPNILPEKFAASLNLPVFKTSALTGEQVEPMFLKLAELAFLRA